MSNINGANQHTPDPREQTCWDFYVESIATGQPNAYDSAIRAGYEEDSARNITLRGWFKERLSKLTLEVRLTKAEKILDQTLDYSPVDEEGKLDRSLLKIQNDTAKFIAETVGKANYSKRSELTGNNGTPLNIAIVQYGTDNNTA